MRWRGLGRWLSGWSTLCTCVSAWVWIPTVMLILDIHGVLPAVSLSGSREGCFRISWLIIRRAGCSDITQESLSQYIRWRVVKDLRWLLCVNLWSSCACVLHTYMHIKNLDKATVYILIDMHYNLYTLYITVCNSCCSQLKFKCWSVTTWSSSSLLFY